MTVANDTSPTVASSSWRLYAKLGYFAMGCGMGPLFSYCSLLLLAKGFTFQTMGLLMSLWPIARTIAVPPLALLADKTGRPDRIFSVTVLTSALSSVLFSSFWTPSSIDPDATVLGGFNSDQLYSALFLFLFFVAAASLNPLYDQHVLGLLERHVGADSGRQEWGRFRMMLSIGYGVSAPVAGLLKETSLGWSVIGLSWAMSHAVVGICFLKTFTRKEGLATVKDTTTSSLDSNSPGAHDTDGGAEAGRHEVGLWAVMSVMLAKPMLIVYVLEASMVGAALQAFNSFLFPLAQTLGAGTGFLGFTVLAMVAIETIVFWQAHVLLRTFSLHQLFFSGLVSLGVRCVGYATMTSPLWIVPLNMLHGFTFACMWLAAVQLYSTSFPSHLGNSGMGVLNMGVWGAGCLVGNVVGGILYQAIGPRWMFGAFALVGLFTSVTFAAIVGPATLLLVVPNTDEDAAKKPTVPDKTRACGTGPPHAMLEMQTEGAVHKDAWISLSFAS